MKNTYFAGGLYAKTKTVIEVNPRTKQETVKVVPDGDKHVFLLVKGTDKTMPYLTHKKDGLDITKHHSALYMLSESGTKALKVRDETEMGNPAEVELTEEQQSEIRKAVACNNYYD